MSTPNKVSASSTVTIDAPAEAVAAALADYSTVRPKLLTEHFHDYRVVEGGVGSGTVAEWTLQATKKRSRQVRAVVEAAGNTITERDANSSMVTTWSVEPSGTASVVTTSTEWNGASGVGGFFERTFAPLGLRKIQAAMLSNLQAHLAG
ncbi:SRPBCC family protein [Lolliginicoccus suaedae]|uniref:SRPBCC family protein n=1 Tax=Lolliginicoccus suaedae TaxID=2605429 RepID=UPI0011F00A1F|nr:SRPBCC family protein [Lolliginicoccus suaedae]